MSLIQETDFPTPSDKIFEVLGAIWTFVCDLALKLLCSMLAFVRDLAFKVLCSIWTFVRDLALVLWSYVSQAFWAVWTYPPLVPIQMIDFPTLCDKILEVLCAIWTFVRDLALKVLCSIWTLVRDLSLKVLCLIWNFVRDRALVPWSYVSQAFWTVWTCPPFETFRNGLVVAWITWKNFASAHPIIAVVLALVVLAFIVVPWFRIFVLRCLGFMKNVPKGSMFALLQSLGARSGSPSVTATAIAVAIVVLGIVVIPRVLKGLWIFFLHCLGFLVWGVLRGPLVFAHPVIIAAVIVVLTLVAIPRLLEALKIVFLHCLSFLGRGVLRPYAANYQSTEREERPDAYTVPVAASEERRAGGGGGYPAVGSTTGRR